MSTQTLGSVSSDVLGQYTQIGKLVLATYRAGVRRIVSGGNTRYAAALNSRALPLVNEAVKASLIQVHCTTRSPALSRTAS
jgi:hypothetical protein